MGAHVEWTHGVLRAGAKFTDYGDEYEFVCTVIRRGAEGELIGAAGRITKEIHDEIRSTLCEQGITRVRWDRLKSESKISVTRGAERSEKVVALASRA